MKLDKPISTPVGSHTETTTRLGAGDANPFPELRTRRTPRNLLSRYGTRSSVGLHELELKRSESKCSEPRCTLRTPQLVANPTEHILRIGPDETPAAVATCLACAGVSAGRSACLQGCWETCVPSTLTVRVSPECFAEIACTAALSRVSVADSWANRRG